MLKDIKIEINEKTQEDKSKIRRPSLSKKKRKLNFINLIFSVIILYFLYTSTTQLLTINKLSKEIETKSLKKVESEALVSQIKEDIEKLKDEKQRLELIEKIARDDYKMVKPGEIIYLDKNKEQNLKKDILDNNN